MNGTRIYPTDRPDNGTKGLLFTTPGQYGRDDDGQWWGYAPRGGVGILSDHEVVEHENGTISVSPSILNDKWHGYLVKGEWIEV